MLKLLFFRAKIGDGTGTSAKSTGEEQKDKLPGGNSAQLRHKQKKRAAFGDFMHTMPDPARNHTQTSLLDTTRAKHEKQSSLSITRVSW